MEIREITEANLFKQITEDFFGYDPELVADIAKVFAVDAPLSGYDVLHFFQNKDGSYHSVIERDSIETDDIEEMKIFLYRCMGEENEPHITKIWDEKKFAEYIADFRELDPEKEADQIKNIYICPAPRTEYAEIPVYQNKDGEFHTFVHLEVIRSKDWSAIREWLKKRLREDDLSVLELDEKDEKIAQDLAKSILEEIRSIPFLKKAKSFSALHDVCDANMLGDTNKICDELGLPGKNTIIIIGRAQTIVDEALKQKQVS